MSDEYERNLEETFARQISEMERASAERVRSIKCSTEEEIIEEAKKMIKQEIESMEMQIEGLQKECEAVKDDMKRECEEVRSDRINVSFQSIGGISDEATAPKETSGIEGRRRHTKSKIWSTTDSITSTHA